MREIDKRDGQNYNRALLGKQFSTVAGRILRHALPSSPKKALTVLAAEEKVSLAKAA